jgi:hypothetical protein
MAKAKQIKVVTIDDVAEAAIKIQIRQAEKNPIEAARQKQVRNQLTVSYGGIYDIES